MKLLFPLTLSQALPPVVYFQNQPQRSSKPSDASKNDGDGEEQWTTRRVLLNVFFRIFVCLYKLCMDLGERAEK